MGFFFCKFSITCLQAAIVIEHEYHRYIILRTIYQETQYTKCITDIL